MAPTKAEYAKIHIAVKDLGLSEDEYRDVLRMNFGKTSSKDLSPRQTRQLLDMFRQRGWKPKKKKRKDVDQAQDKQSRKIRALWISLKNLGALRDPSERALLKFVKNETGIERLEWCDREQKSKLIETLKSWLSRETRKVENG